MSNTTTTPTKSSIAPVSAQTAHDPWHEIGQLTAEAAVRLPAGEGVYASVKSALDYLLAVLLLPPALLAVGIAAILVKVTSPGPVFYTQTRVGLHGHRYRIIKIRTMHHNCELASGIQWATKQDNRVTRIGRLLRLTHIDELPQLWNVLRGEMSLVGPRPERPEVIQSKGLDQLVPGYNLRLSVKPGVTGLAQVQLPADTDITSVRHKVVYDLYYVQNQGLLLDLRLILATIVKPFLSPKWVRRLFLLPSRKTVAVAFRNQVMLPDYSEPCTDLQPA